MFSVPAGNGELASQSSPPVLGKVHSFKRVGSDGHDSGRTGSNLQFPRNVYGCLGHYIFLTRAQYNTNIFITNLRHTSRIGVHIFHMIGFSICNAECIGTQTARIHPYENPWKVEKHFSLE